MAHRTESNAGTPCIHCNALYGHVHVVNLEDAMKILMTGGTGFLGQALRQRLEASGHTITCLSRGRSGVQGGTTYVQMAALKDIEPHDAVINLAGESVVGLWTPKKRRAIYDSRIETTRSLSDWIERSAVKPSVFLSSSAVGIYGDAADLELTEKTDVSRTEGFLAKVCRDWEHAASSSSWKGTRTVLFRTGQVLDPSGGYFGKVLLIFRRFPIVILGSRQSYCPWIALDDWLGIAMLALEDASIAGPVNLVGPNPVTQGEFVDEIAKRLKKRVWGRVPAWALKLGTGEFGSALTASLRVLPEQALAAGYVFEFPSLAGYLDMRLSARRP